MSKILYVYDDEGALASATVSDFETEQEAAVSIIDELIDWTDDQGRNLYDDVDVKTHIKELEKLKSNVISFAVELNEQAWFETSLGFTFSCGLND
ncbi:hypothetical protein [Aliivibrio fischeri]|uniref:Uncharacterized protein n=1 Tax=Aliivibrio fischeri TaxID=668 RepID=A0A510UQE3_ALIFS|nr:hypothetical protein [Aliivibrio fischeri]GEK15420.1 hypothetical protein AFI02nite_34560 [Aliivibrio fischeri]